MSMFKIKQMFTVHKFKMFPGRFVHIKVFYLYTDILTTSTQLSPSMTNSRSATKSSTLQGTSMSITASRQPAILGPR